MPIHEKLQHIQTELKCPKNQFNAFARYKYRNCEDILEGVKPLLDKYKCTLVLTDQILLIGERYYIQATATITDAETGEKLWNTGIAREDDSKKGMDSSQLTGACSSYARKYALNGLFCIDDTKDADSMDNTKQGGQAPQAGNNPPSPPKRRSRIQKPLDDDCPF